MNRCKLVGENSNVYYDLKLEIEFKWKKKTKSHVLTFIVPYIKLVIISASNAYHSFMFISLWSWLGDIDWSVIIRCWL